jgi:hypothetical protein
MDSRVFRSFSGVHVPASTRLEAPTPSCEYFAATANHWKTTSFPNEDKIVEAVKSVMAHEAVAA